MGYASSNLSNHFINFLSTGDFLSKIFYVGPQGGKIASTKHVTTEEFFSHERVVGCECKPKLARC